jgi:hypothetical protein
MFNDSSYFANNQLEDNVVGVNWNLEDDSMWKCVNPKAIAVLPRYHILPNNLPFLFLFIYSSSIIDRSFVTNGCCLTVMMTFILFVDASQ